MSILNDQSIIAHPDLGGATEWQKNLGRNHTETVGDPDSQPINGKFSGFSYGPPDLPAIRRTLLVDIEGPRGLRILDGSSDEGSYGPNVESRIPSYSGAGVGGVASLLGGFAHQLGRTPSTIATSPGMWATNGFGQKLKQTMTTGSQLASLRDTSLGVDNVPTSSGGLWYGYQFGTEYGISNWNATETQTGTTSPLGEEDSDARMMAVQQGITVAEYLESQRTFTREDEEITGHVDDITLTGLRSIPGMATP